MSFDIVPFDVGFAVTQWLKVVLSITGLALSVVMLASLATCGRSGPRLVLKHIFSGALPLVCGAVGGVAAAYIGGVLGYESGDDVFLRVAGWINWEPGETAQSIASVCGAALTALVFFLVAAVFCGALVDACSVSPRRVFALAMLTFKESTRRKTLLVGVIFLLLFMFAGWFLSNTNPRAELQVKVYVSFVLTAISWLILPVALLLSCWGLPDDIKRRTLHTVVTKPVRRSEIILGRMLGFSLIGTLVLGMMGFFGYFWITRNIPQSAQSMLTCRVPVYGTLSFLDREGNPGRGVNVGDIWDFREFIEGATRARAIWEFSGVTPAALVKTGETEHGEPVRRLLLESGIEAFRTHKGVDPNRGVLCEMAFVLNTRERVARSLSGSPGFGRLGALVADGDFQAAAAALAQVSTDFAPSKPNPPAEEYRQIAAGFSDVAALLEPIASKHSDDAWIKRTAASCTRCAEAAGAKNSEQLAKSLRELSGLFAKNADDLSRLIVDIRVPLPVFEVKEFKDHVIVVDPDNLRYTVDDAERRDVNLFKDLVRDGRLRVEARCVDAGQYLGMARPDLFVRTPDRPFWSGYSKSIFGIWLMMELVVVLGVTAGSLLNGPVSTFVVFVLLIVGQWFREFLEQIVEGQISGGGTFESIIRIVRHLNPTTELEKGALTTTVRLADDGITNGLWLAAQVIPDFSPFGRTLKFLPNGFDVDWAKTLLPAIALTVGYLLPGLLIGYYCLKLRELEEK